MKDFFISNSDGKVKICQNANDCSLPVLIRFNQYEAASRSTGNTLEIGTMGNQSFDFDLDYYNFGKRSSHVGDSFDFLEDKLSGALKTGDNSSAVVCPIIRKDEIFTNFLVLEISDYGSQSMSPFFRDFVPHVFLNKRKLWQKYIGILRYYSKRKAYILIDKRQNNLNVDSLEDIDVDIRICFKNKLQKEKSTESTTILEMSAADGLHFSGEETSSLFLHGSFDINDSESFFGDYTILTNDNTVIHPMFIQEIRFEKESGFDINKQTGGSGTKDYFKQSIIKKGSGEVNSGWGSVDDYTRETTVSIRVVLKEGLRRGDNQIKYLKLVPRANIVDAVYSYDDVSNTYGSVNTATMHVFDSEGKFITLYNYIDEKDGEYKNKNFEFIPEYDTTRKIFIEDGGTLGDLNSLKKKIKKASPYLQHWNLSSNKWFGYLSDGSLAGDLTNRKDYPKKIKYVYLYDNEVGGDNNNITPADSASLSFVFSTDLIDSSEVIDTYYSRDAVAPEQDFDTGSSASNTFYLPGFNRCPLSFYMRSKDKKDANGNTVYEDPINYDIIAFVRAFPIKFEKRKIDSRTALFKLPDYFVYDDKLNKDTFNPKLNNTFLNALEKKMFISKESGGNLGNGFKVSENFIIFNINHFNRKLTAKDSYYNDYSVNINCINFSGRNEEK